MEKKSWWTNQMFLTFGICWLEQMSLSHKHKPSCLWTSQYNTRATKNVGLEYFSIPISPRTPNSIACTRMLIKTEENYILIRWSSWEILKMINTHTQKQPFLFGCKEDIWVLRVELKGLSNVRPTHWSWRELNSFIGFFLFSYLNYIRHYTYEKDENVTQNPSHLCPSLCLSPLVSRC